jgi:hypothetical protein
MSRKWLELSLFAPGTLRLNAERLPDALLELGGRAVIGFELGFGALVLWRRTRPVATIAGLSFHVMNGLCLGIWFWFLTPSYVALVDWARLLSADRPASAPPRPTPRSPVLAIGVLFVALEALAIVHDLSRLPIPSYGQPWPFAIYPTFAGRMPRDVAIVDVGWVDAAGARSRVDVDTWAAAVGPSYVAWDVAAGIADDPDAQRRSDRAVELARVLFRHTPPARRAEVNGAVIMLARYDLTLRPDGSWPPPDEQQLAVLSRSQLEWNP